MITPQIVAYVKSTLQQGYTEDKVREALLRKGWKIEDIEEAFAAAKTPGAPVARPPLAQAPPEQRPALPVQRPLTPAPTAMTTPATAGVTAGAAPPTPGSPTPALPTPASQQFTPTSPQGPRQPAATLPGTPGASAPPLSWRPEPQAARPPMAAASPGGAAPSFPRFEPPPGGSARPPVAPVEEESTAPRPAAVSYPTISSIALEEETSATSNKKKILIGAGVAIVLIAAYVTLGLTRGLTLFGVNLFPLSGLLGRFGAVSSPAPTVAPTPPPAFSPPPSPPISPTPTPPPARRMAVYGSNAEAGSLQALSWSADARKAAYTLLAGESNLWTLDLETGSKSNLLKTRPTNFPATASILTLSWSPTGESIAFVAKNDLGVANLYLIDVQGQRITMLSNATSSRATLKAEPLHAPQWRPDGKTILYVVGDDLWSVAKENGARTQITKGIPIGSARWSPDGSEILYTIRRAATENVWLMNADGKNYRGITFGGVNQQPKFSPDGKTILYSSRDAASARDQLYAIERDGSNLRKLTATTNVIREFSWSPDGRWISYLNRSESGRQTLWLMRRDGSDSAELLGLGEYEPLGFLGWSQRGDALLAAGVQHFLISAALRPEEIGTSPLISPSLSPAASPTALPTILPTTSPVSSPTAQPTLSPRSSPIRLPSLPPRPRR